MKILVAVDRQAYSRHTVKQAAELAANTFADVTILGVSDATQSRDEKYINEIFSVLGGYRELFLSRFPKEYCPYLELEYSYRWIRLDNHTYQEILAARSKRKSLNLKLRFGNPAREILKEAEEFQSDLIVTGCDPDAGCTWVGRAGVPMKVANDADCSVLVTKGETRVEQIVCCLDQKEVTQASVELINQFVTIHNARLVIAGIVETKGLDSGVEHQMGSIQRYYDSLNITPIIQVIDTESLEEYISKKAEEGMLAIWMGKKSVLGKFLPRSRVNRLLKAGTSPVLLLR